MEAAATTSYTVTLQMMLTHAIAMGRIQPEVMMRLDCHVRLFQAGLGFFKSRSWPKPQKITIRDAARQM